MKQIRWAFVSILLLSGSHRALAQADKAPKIILTAQTAVVPSQGHNNQSAAVLDAQREKGALQIFLKSVQNQIVSAADAMPADKYGFAPTEGEFKGVRTARFLRAEVQGDVGLVPGRDPYVLAPFGNAPLFGSADGVLAFGKGGKPETTLSIGFRGLEVTAVGSL